MNSEQKNKIEQVLREIKYHLDPHCMVPKHVLKDWEKYLTESLETPKANPKGNSYTVRARCDWEEQFCIDEFQFTIDTDSLAEAALYAEEHFRHHTPWEIKRND